MELGLPVAARGDLAVLPVHVMPGQELVDPFEKSLLHGIVLEGEVVAQGRLVKFFLHLWMGEDGFYLGSVVEILAFFPIEEGFDPEHVPGQEHGLLFLIPYGKGEHPPQPV